VVLTVSVLVKMSYIDEATIHSWSKKLHHFSPIRMTLNDLESPIHLQVRLVDGTLDGFRSAIARGRYSHCIMEKSLYQGRPQGGKWTQLASSFAQGGFLPPPPGSLTLQAYEPCVLFTTLKACIRN